MSGNNNTSSGQHCFLREDSRANYYIAWDLSRTRGTRDKSYDTGISLAWLDLMLDYKISSRVSANVNVRCETNVQMAASEV